ncbi:hypothetical protein Kuja_0030 [Vibrio phage vB_VchM_Kuja]|uniref:Baseplate wedge protein gp6-like N-terminal helical domain-containing protein n=1 Tax=Vibrio phage vB_VchM_Kuja TaxID=2686437 RepID=A0A6B9J7J6_9CAUD|nr:hypothetical protein HWC83_gp003 [Vibrio phage vB_VchM_Kuja]QGZ15994.1 hypothetical protein Kuja_0030 [Vibrio phage vB_VchM_Kuja]
MSKIAITDADYDGKLLGLIEHMKTTDTFSDYNYEGSAIRSILRVLALHASDSALYANLTFNERYIKTAEIRANVVSAAQDNHGYISNSVVCSKTFADITVRVDSSLSEVTLRKTSVFVGVKDGQTIAFSPSIDYQTAVVNGIAQFKSITLLQGTWKVITKDIDSQRVQKILIDDDRVDITTIRTIVSGTDGNEEYTRYRNAFDLGVDQRIFFISIDRDEKYIVELGDGVLSKKPSNGIIYLQYLATDGSDGNGITKVTPLTTIGDSSDITVTLLQPSANGSEKESIDSVKLNAPLSYGSGGLAVVANQYKPIVREIYPSSDVACWGGEDNIPKKNGYVMISVKPENGAKLTNEEKLYLVNALKGRNVGSITPIIVDPSIIYLRLAFKQYWDPRLTASSESAMKTVVTNSIRAWESINIKKFQRNFDPLFLSNYVNDADRSFVSNSMLIDLEIKFDVLNNVTSTIRFNKKIEKDSVYVDGIRFGTIEYYARDLNGKLQLFSANNNLIINADVGEVNYETGLCSLYLPNGFMGQSRIIATPSDNDLIFDVLRNEIIEISDIKVEMKIRRVEK